MKQCSRCGKSKSIESDFDWNGWRGGVHRKHPQCKTCRKKEHDRYYAENRESILERHGPIQRESYYLKTYGLTTVERQALIDAQNGLCGLGHPAEKLVIDHDHQTGLVRGVLCEWCNVAIGHFKNDPSLMLAAAKYIEQQGSVGERRAASLQN